MDIIGISACRLAAKIEAVAPLLVGDVLGVLALALNAYLAASVPSAWASRTHINVLRTGLVYNYMTTLFEILHAPGESPNNRACLHRVRAAHAPAAVRRTEYLDGNSARQLRDAVLASIVAGTELCCVDVAEHRSIQDEVRATSLIALHNLERVIDLGKSVLFLWRGQILSIRPCPSRPWLEL